VSYERRFSEGADNKASKGFLDLLGGFCIVVFDKAKTLERQRRKVTSPKNVYPF